MRKVIIAGMLALSLTGCGAATTDAAPAVNVTESSTTTEEGENMSRSKVYYCEVIDIDDETISLEDSGTTYIMPVKGNEWVSIGDRLLLECKEESLKEESENTFVVIEGLLSKLEKNEKAN